MNYWMVKQEPTAYSWDDFVKDGKTDWTGVRNFKARNFLKEMKEGDKVYFYHSVVGKEVVGIAKVLGVKEGRWPLLYSLKSYLTNKQMLLVLDNLEHVMAAKSIIVELLAASDGVRILATSRATTSVGGPSTRAAGTSRRWRFPSCSPPT